MKILITGGLGFIGSNLARRLVKEGHDVTLLDSLIPGSGGNLANVKDFRENVRINISDLRDRLATRQLLKNVDTIFNLAGQTSHSNSMAAPINDLDINARAQLMLLEDIRQVCPEAVVVFTSTRQVYGRPHYLPVDEKHPIIPVDINGINKAAAEQFHLLYHSIHGMRTVALRLTNTYGPAMRIKDSRQTFLGYWIRQLLSGNTIEVFGDGSQLRDLNHIDDVVNALIYASKTLDCFGTVVNLGGNEVISLSTLADLLCRLHSPKGKWELVPFPPHRKIIDIGSYYGNYSQARSLYGWHPEVGIEEGLASTLLYYQQNLVDYI